MSRTPAHFYDIAQSPWTDDSRIYASQKSSAGDAKQREKHEIFTSDATSAKHAGSAKEIVTGKLSACFLGKVIRKNISEKY